MVKINRWECNALENTRSWLLVYGRRKVGKTWLLRHCTLWSLYITVTRSGKCVTEDRRKPPWSLQEPEECIRRLSQELARGGAIVVLDEFQRLPEEYWDIIALLGREAKGTLILCGSSMGIVNRVFDKRSPLLGLFAAFHVKLISMSDAVSSLAEKLSPRDALLWAPIARDPWAIPHLNFKEPPWIELTRKARSLVPAAQGLIGEVFLEEERKLTRLYEATLRLLALGEWNAAAMAQRLYSSRLISAPHPGVVTGVLDVLAKMGLAAPIRLWKTRRAKVYYRHASPLLSLLLYMDESTAGLEYTPRPEAVKTRFSIELQFAIGELLAEHHGYVQAYTILPGGEGDVDVVLLDEKGLPRWAYEVKMGEATSKDAERLSSIARKLGIPRVGIVSLLEKPSLETVDETLGPSELVRVARNIKKRREKRPPG